MYTVKVSMHSIKEAKGPWVTNSKMVYDHCADMGSLCQETMQVLTLNTRSRVIDRHMVSMGTVNSAPFHPRDGFRCAIMDNATSGVFIHNHPSGSLEPSPEDIESTRIMKEAGELLKIPVLDHIIITKNGYYSFRDSGYI
jgi:DNA repair protein RadC